MKIFLPFLMFIIACLFYSCSNNDVLTGKNVYKTDFESVDGWIENLHLIKSDAHSGNYCCNISPENPYSLTFKKRIGDFGLKSIDKIKVSAWVKFTDLNSTAKLVVSIDSTKSGHSSFWFGLSAEDFIIEKNQWSQVSGEVTLSKKFNDDFMLLVFLWNTGNKPVYLDDLSFQVVER